MRPALSIRSLSKMYENGVHALKDVTLEISPGDFCALLGPNGAGKTTLIGSIASLVNKSQGYIEVFGKSLDKEPLLTKGFIGLVPQEFNASIFEPVECTLLNQAGFYGIPRGEAKDLSDHYLHQLGLWEKRKQLIKSLSGGMKRRFLIARGLMGKPKLLLLDEPTAGVDVEVRQQTWAFLKELNAQGLTILLTTHYLEEAEQLCNRVAIIQGGQLIADTSMSTLLKQATTETVILYLKDPAPTSLDLSDYLWNQLTPHTLEVHLRAEQHLHELFQELTQRRIEVARLKNKMSRLESLFLQLLNSRGT